MGKLRNVTMIRLWQTESRASISMGNISGVECALIAHKTLQASTAKPALMGTTGPKG